MLKNAIIGFLFTVAVSACATSNENVYFGRNLFEEPRISTRGSEVYRLFWFSKRQTPIAVIISDSSGAAPTIELKSTNGKSTYNEGAFDKHYSDAIALHELRRFRERFEGFSDLIADDDEISRDATEADEVGKDDTMIICLHPSSYSVEVKNTQILHYISRSACQDSFDSDLKYVAPFIRIADEHFTDELSEIISFEDYPLLQAEIGTTEYK